LKKYLAAILFLSMAIGFPAYAIEEAHEHHTCECGSHHHKTTPVDLRENSVLTIRDCISLGIQNSPVIKEKAYEYELAKSNVGIAKSQYFPELYLGAGYLQEFNSNSEEYSRRYRELPNVGVAINKMIYDFGKTNAKIKMEEFITIAAEYEFEDSVCESVFRIKEHYYELLGKKSLWKAAQTDLEIQNSIISEIKKLSNKSNNKEADLLTATVQEKQAQSNLIDAENKYKNAKENLSNVLYLTEVPEYSIYETQSFNYKTTMIKSFSSLSAPKSEKIAKDDTIFQHPTFSYDEAIKIANTNSPDLKALKAVRDAMEQAVLLTKRQNYPELNVSGGYNFVNTSKYSNNGFNVALGLETDINFMENKYEIAGAKAQLDIASTEIELFAKNLSYRVRKALNSLNKTYANLPIANEQMNAAAKNFDKIFEQYKSGKANYIDVFNAKNLYIESLENYINSQVEYNAALINLEMAMHEHLIDYHDDAEHAVNFHAGDENSTLSKLIKCNKKHKPKKE